MRVSFKKFLFIILLLSGVVIAIIVSFYARRHPGIHRIVFISIDTCRADYLSCYGYRRKTTPNIDKLADNSYRFTNVISPIPLTLPAHCSILTGTIPPYHGVHDNVDYKLDESIKTLAEVLREEGFVTGAILGSYVLDRQFGLAQGFGHYDSPSGEGTMSDEVFVERQAEEVSRLGIEWIENNRDDRFFLFLHYYDPHTKYEPPQPFASRYSDNLYAGEVAYTDYCIGQVIDKLKDMGLYNSATIIVTSDHGEMLGEHGEKTHGFFVYQSAIRVPLIIKLSGQKGPKQVSTLAGLVDIFPTLCKLLNVSVPSDVHGADLMQYFSGHEKRDEGLFAESLYATKYGGNSLLSIITERWKYIQTTQPELYDLGSDAGETVNLVGQHPQVAQDLQAQLREILEKTTQTNKNQEEIQLEEDTLKRLESLGYVVGSSVEEDYKFDQTKDDPKELIDFHLSHIEVSRLISQQRYSQAREICETMILQRPGHFNSRFNLARIALEQGELVEAFSHLTIAAELSPDDPRVYHNLGIVLARQDKFDEAIFNFSKGLELDPENSETHLNLAFAYMRSGKKSRAIQHFEKSLELKPGQLTVHMNLANLYHQQGITGEAIYHWSTAVELKPDFVEALNSLAWVKSTCSKTEFSNPKEALVLAMRAVELTGRKEPGVLDTLSVAHAANGKFSEAVKTSEDALGLAESMGRTNLVEEIRHHLDLFRAGHPYLQVD